MIVIHIGLKKAGSTSIQAFLNDNEDALRRQSVDFAQIGRRGKSTAHHNFAREIITALRKFNAAYGTLSELAEYWRNAPAQTLVITSELFEEGEVEQIAVLKETLARARENEEFRIVLVLRELLDLMPSSYAQKVKYGVKTHDFDAFFEERMQARRINYFETAKRWADVFGWESLRLRLLDRKYLVNGELIDDFMSLCGLDPGSEVVELAKRTGQVNASPGWKVLEATRALFDGRHRLNPDRRIGIKMKLKEKQQLGRLLMQAGNKRGWNDDRGYYLTRDQAQKCLDIFRTNIDAFNAHLSEPLPMPPDLDARGFHEREFLPDADCIPSRELRDFYEDVRLLKAATWKPSASPERKRPADKQQKQSASTKRKRSKRHASPEG